VIRFVLTWLAVFLAGAFAGQQFTLWQGMRRIRSLIKFLGESLGVLGSSEIQELFRHALARDDDGVAPREPGGPAPYRESIHDRA
jgi:hypothetical protein